MEKKLGLPSAIAVSVGLIVASSCLLSLGQGVGLAGKGFVFAMLIVLILNICLALSFKELYDIMPNVEGGLGQYTKAGLGAVPSIIANISAYFVVSLLGASVEIAMCGMVIQSIFLPQVPVEVISILFLAVLVFINYKGVDLFAKIQDFVVALLLFSLIIMGVCSFFKLGTGSVIAAEAQTTPAVTGIRGCISMSAMAFWLFMGIEFVIPVAKDLKNPRRDVFLAMVLGLIILFVVQSVLGVGMTHYVTLDELSSSEMPHMVFMHNLFGRAGEVWMGIVTILAGISTANTVLGSVPRVLGGMAENDLLPRVLDFKNKHDVNTVGLFLIAVGDAVVIASGLTESAGLSTLLLAATCFWVTSYILINLTVLILRKRFPDIPGRNKKFTLFGIPQIIAIIGDIYMILNIAQGDERIFIYKVYLIILLIMILFSVIWVKFVKKQPMFKGATLEEIINMK